MSDTQATYFEVLKRASSFLEENDLSPFAAEWLLRERLEWSKTDLVKHYREPMIAEDIAVFTADVNQFYNGKPMQQIIGHDWFYNRKFIVNEHTLIPRPETEEWLDRVLKLLPSQPLKVLDIGTGTGVLAITQKLERPEDDVTAVDISVEALKVAQQNAERLKAAVDFKKSDLFQALEGERYDLILSNPPYISESEIDLMDESVLKHEPKEALFAENDGLAIYEALALNIKNYLTEKSSIILEIGYAQGEKVVAIFQKVLPDAKIEVWQDFNGLDRVVAIYN